MVRVTVVVPTGFVTRVSRFSGSYSIVYELVVVPSLPGLASCCRWDLDKGLDVCPPQWTGTRSVIPDIARFMSHRVIAKQLRSAIGVDLARHLP